MDGDVSVINDTYLYATDSDGDRITAVKQGGETVVPTADIDISKLYGTWVCSNITLTFTESTMTQTLSDVENSDGTVSTNTETLAYSYDEDSHTLSFLGDGSLLTITALTDSRLALAGFRIDGEISTPSFARKGIEVGDISLLYGKTWTMSMNGGVWLTFKADGTGTFSVYDDEEGEIDLSSTWTYNTNTKKITVSAGGEKVMDLTLTGLTSDILLCLCSWYPYSPNIVFYAE